MSDKIKTKSVFKDNDIDGEQKTEKWGTNIEFILTCLSYVIGFGNIWRFPYICYKNGGGAFLIPYGMSLVFLGLPLIVIEMTLGQYSGIIFAIVFKSIINYIVLKARGKVIVWKFMPIFFGTGISMLIVVAMQSIYYNMLVAWSLYYFFSSFTLNPLPWRECGNEWNTRYCTNGSINDTFRSPSEEYLHENILKLNNDMENISTLNWKSVLCLIIAWILVYFSLFKGIRSMGKVSYMTAIFPYICLVILLIRGITLDGAMDGIKFYMIPKWERLLESSVWIDASQQIFFSLGVAWGMIITLSSHNDFANHLIRDAVIIAFGNSFTSIFAGFVIFSYMGSVAYERKVDISEVATQGPGLAFIMYPEAVAKFPLGQLFSIVFFFMLILLGMGTQTPNVESLMSTLFDFFPKKRKTRPIILALLCSIFFFIGLLFCTKSGMYWFELFSGFCASTSAMFIGLVEVIAISWVYGIDKFFDHIKEMVGQYPRPAIAWKIVIKYITPTYLSLILFLTVYNTKSPKYGDYTFPFWTVILGWMVNLGAILPIPIVATFYLCKCYSNEHISFKDVSNPDVNWKSKDSPKSPSPQSLSSTNSQSLTPTLSSDFK